MKTTGVFRRNRFARHPSSRFRCLLQSPSPVLRGTRLRSRCVARSFPLSTLFECSSFQIFSQRHSTYICHAFTISLSIKGTVIWLLRFCPEEPILSLGADWLAYTDSGPPEPNIIYSTSPGPDLPTDATPRPRSVLAGRSPRRGNASGFQRTFEAQGLGARVARRTRTAPPRPRSTPWRAHGVSCPGAINLAEIRDLVPGSSVGKQSWGRALSVRW